MVGGDKRYQCPICLGYPRIDDLGVLVPCGHVICLKCMDRHGRIWSTLSVLTGPRRLHSSLVGSYMEVKTQRNCLAGTMKGIVLFVERSLRTSRGSDLSDVGRRDARYAPCRPHMVGRLPCLLCSWCVTQCITFIWFRRTWQ